MIKLTEKQMQVFDLIKSTIKANGIPPTMVEMAEEMEVYPNAVRGHVAALIKKGAITQGRGKIRSIQPVKGVRVRIKGDK